MMCELCDCEATEPPFCETCWHQYRLAQLGHQLCYAKMVPPEDHETLVRNGVVPRPLTIWRRIGRFFLWLWDCRSKQGRLRNQVRSIARENESAYRR